MVSTLNSLKDLTIRTSRNRYMNTENTQIGHFDSTASPGWSILHARLQPNALFRIKLAAQCTFGCLILFDSLYLVLCYVTFDFFGCLYNPFFGWLRACGFVAWILYFPMFLGALVGIDFGNKKKLSRRLAGIFLVAQLVAGLALYFLSGVKSPLGWSMVYGPNVRTPMGDILTYIDAVSCLLPLSWISVTHVITALPRGQKKTIAGTPRFSSFVMAALASSLLYSVWANVRMAAGGQPRSIVGLVFSMAAHLGIFAGLFLVLQWVRVISNRFPDPSIAQFAMRSLAAWLGLAFLLRKIIFPLLAFNNSLADLYALVFSLAAVLFIAGLVLKIRELYAVGEAAPTVSNRSWLRPPAVLLLTISLFWIFATRLAAIEWEHIIGTLVALMTWVLLLWFFLSLSRRPAMYRSLFLILLSAFAIADLAGARLMFSRSSLPGGAINTLEQYADYDPSLFLIQQALQPALHDEAYASFYQFLNQHANIGSAGNMPEIMLAGDLKPAASRKPNIFLFVIDALRRDYVSPYNSDVTFTPAIDAFARDSSVFRNAYTFYAGTALAEPAIWAGFQQLHAPYRPLSSFSSLQRMLSVDSYHSYISYDEVLRILVPASPEITVLNNSFSQSKLNEFGAVVSELEDDLRNAGHGTPPIFVYAQPANVHTLSLALHGGVLQTRHHPGFNEKYASAVEQVDATFGEFIRFLKAQNLYENSIIILTADHGESLGEMGREGHAANLTPEVMRIPLIIHLPEWQKTALIRDTEAVASLHDITPTLYYLLGHRPIRNDSMFGHPLFTSTKEEQIRTPSDHYFLMSSYMPIFGILSADQNNLFVVDANLRRNFYYDLKADPHALKNRITAPLRDYSEDLIRRDLTDIDRFYGRPEYATNR